jgi:molecular chaperone Hsp33
MANTDFLIRGILKKEHIRFVFTDTTFTVQQGILIHNTDPLAAEIFGEALTAAALISPLLEGDEGYSIRWEYPGEVKSLIANVNSQGDVRGIIKQPHLMNVVKSENDVFGKEDGFISIVKSAEGKILNSGQTRAALADPAADVAFFFSVSDQLETEIAATSKFNPDPENPVDIACGFMLQAMPGCDLSALDEYRHRMNTELFLSILQEQLPEEKKLWKLLAAIEGRSSSTPDKENAIYQFGNSPSFRCNCNHDKMKQALRVLEKEDLKKLFEENSNPAISCQFCHKKYHFTKSEFFLK